MPLDERRDLIEHWADVTAEPGGVDYIETDAGGVPAMWAVPKGCAQDRVILCLQHCFHMSAGRAPEADEGIRRWADWVRPKLGLGDGAGASGG
jgi:hypothetical protein